MFKIKAQVHVRNTVHSFNYMLDSTNKEKVVIKDLIKSHTNF